VIARYSSYRAYLGRGSMFIQATRMHAASPPIALRLKMRRSTLGVLRRGKAKPTTFAPAFLLGEPTRGSVAWVRKHASWAD
jgi:hypothetical protein